MSYNIVKLEELVKIKGGKRLPKGANLQKIVSEHPYIRVRDMGNKYIPREGLEYVPNKIFPEIDKYIVESGDLIISIVGTIGLISIIDEYFHKASLTENCAKLNGLDEIDGEFLYYFLISKTGQDEIHKNTVGAVQRKLPLYGIKNIDVIWPDKRKRNAIVNALSSIDQKIHLNQQTNKTLESIAQAIFKSWFVDFDPVRAKIRGKVEGYNANRAAMAAIAGVDLKQDWDDIEAALEQKLSRMNENPRQQLQRTAELFPDELVDSELGEVPKGWGVSNYGNLIDYMIGGDWGKKEPDKKHTEKVKILRGTDLPDIFNGNDNSVPVRFVQAKKLKTRKLQDGDIVFEISGGSKNQSTGRNLFINQKILDRFKIDLAPASFCRLMRPKSITLSYFLGVYLRKAYDDELMWQFQVQSTGISNFQTNLFMEQHKLVVPSEQILEQFQKTVEPIFDNMYSNENSELKKLRDTLLPKLISGEVEV